ncbi:hypothetical protein K474DRAFT_1710460 [Panus rudis PR-1116 ss-1]|nr:hypothetical protein K474DRAFT_1710460 [Panus rudis PR-1116 ss-1]
MADEFLDQDVEGRFTTPFQVLIDGLLPHKAVTLLAKELYQYVADETYAHSIGPMPTRVLYPAFMALKEGVTKLRPVPKNTFHEVWPPKGDENAMVNAWIEAIEKLDILRNFKFYNVSSKLDPHSGISQRADAALYPIGAIPADILILDWDILSFIAEFKVEPNHDPHRFAAPGAPPIDKKKILDRHERAEAEKARGQIFFYVKAQLARQPDRLFTFAMANFGNHVRFCIIDHTGAIVSEVVWYLKKPRQLVEFIWRYDNLTDEQRGYDPTVTTATQEQSDLLMEAMGQLKAQRTYRELPRMSVKDHENHPFFKVVVLDEATEEKREYIICRSFNENISPFGRSSRVFLALQVDTLFNESGKFVGSRKNLSEQLVLLNDAWRVSENNAESETSVCRELHQLGIPHVPVVKAGGDVRMPETGEVQKTFTQDWARKDGLRWKTQNLELIERTHHRSAQEITWPLTTARNAKELIQVIHDAFECIIQTYAKTGRMHRNVNHETIRISANEKINGLARGVLGGWDGSRLGVEKEEGNVKLYRTGLWQCLSIALLENPRKPHDIYDDAEGIIWVLLYMLVHHCDHNGGLELEMFDEIERQYPANSPPIFVGGAHKGRWMRAEELTLKFSCSALTELVSNVRNFWKGHLSKSQTGLEEEERLSNWEDHLRQVQGFFKYALQHGNWKNSQFHPDRYPQQTVGEERQDHATRRETGTLNGIAARKRSRSKAGTARTRGTRTTGAETNSKSKKATQLSTEVPPAGKNTGSHHLKANLGDGDIPDEEK